MGLIVLQADQRIELDARQQFEPEVNLHISRIPSAATVTTETLKQMEKDLTHSSIFITQCGRF